MTSARAQARAVRGGVREGTKRESLTLTIVMAGLVPAIHAMTAPLVADSKARK